MVVVDAMVLLEDPPHLISMNADLVDQQTDGEQVSSFWTLKASLKRVAVKDDTSKQARPGEQEARRMTFQEELKQGSLTLICRSTTIIGKRNDNWESMPVPPRWCERLASHSYPHAMVRVQRHLQLPNPLEESNHDSSSPAPSTFHPVPGVQSAAPSPSRNHWAKSLPQRCRPVGLRPTNKSLRWIPEK